jgi:RES domain-containing protein
MVVLWRISRHRDLTGIGGLRAAGRWHYAGHPVVYLSENPASALLEVCVHTAANDVPPGFTLLRIEGPELKILAVIESTLPHDWRTRLEVTRKLGTDWLRKKEDVILRLPSAIVPQTTNFLVNPLHPDASRFRITAVFTYPFDGRIKQ